MPDIAGTPGVDSILLHRLLAEHYRQINEVQHVNFGTVVREAFAHDSVLMKAGKYDPHRTMTDVIASTRSVQSLPDIRTLVRNEVRLAVSVSGLLGALNVRCGDGGRAIRKPLTMELMVFASMVKTALMQAAKSGDISAVEDLIRNYADVNGTSNNDGTSFTYAVLDGGVKSCKS